jgi:Transketolase-like TK C-terminal domain/Phosphoglucose isomerase
VGGTDQASREGRTPLHIRELFTKDPGHGERFAVEAAGIFLDFSKNRATDETIALLVQLAAESGLRRRIDAMFRGERINTTEKRQPKKYRDSGLPPAVHTRVAVEQASTFGWERYVGTEGRVVGMNTFGASAPLKELDRHLGFEPTRVAAIAREVLGRT